MVYTKPKIFVIDDNPELLQEILPEYGYNVYISENGQRALDVLSVGRDNFDVILLDILLPEVNGWDILRYIRQNEKYKHVPIIMMSALNNEIDLVSSLKVGADDFITKPFNLSTLIARVEALLRRANWPKNEPLKKTMGKTNDILTAREKDIMHHIAEGLSNRKIAEKLFLSELTVKTHLKNIFKKLNSTNRTQAILTAMDQGIINKK